MNKHFVRLALAAVSLAAAPAILSPSALAQAISVNGGSIQGTITDPSGAVVGNAEVTVTGLDTGYKTTVHTTGSGVYSVGPLNPGRYTVRIVQQGFSELAVSTVVRTGTVTSGNFKLLVGDASQEIEVTAGSIQLNTEQAGVSGVITSQQLDTLPVNGRNILDFAQLQPGVQLQAGGSSDGGFDPTKAGYSALSIGGFSGRTTRILLDGQDITDETVGTTIFNVSQGSVGEMQINRGTQDVSNDIGSSGSVLASTRSGTNAFHGQLFYNFQDQRVGAATFEGISNPFQRNQFGGSVGGPIIKDKLFFFANVERVKQDQSAPATPGLQFSAVQALFPNIGSPARDTYSAGRLDYNGPRGTHFFVRINYEANSFLTAENYSSYANRDNAPGIAGGADFSTGRFTHSFRGSYEKFHNLIGDTTIGNTSIFNPISGYGVTANFAPLTFGPNPNAPQQTFQTDKQLRYDGTYTAGKNSIRFGASMNRILGGGLAAFFGFGPQATIDTSTLLANCNNVAGAAPCPGDPIRGYSPLFVQISNGLGFASEKPGFGLPGGAQGDWRIGIYLTDSIKLTPNFTLTAGVRYDHDTGRVNADLNAIPCSVLTDGNVGGNYSFPGGTPPCTGNSNLLDLWGAGLGNRVHDSNKNIAPQVGFAYTPPGASKTVLRAGIGLFFESNVFNNTQFDRSSRLESGQFASYPTICSGTNTYPVGSTNASSTSTGVSISTICSESILQGADAVKQLQADARAQAGATVNQGFAGYGLAIQNGATAYSPTYRSPYSIQYNAGIQQQIAKGVVLSADYVHTATVRIQQTVDANHVGDSRYLNVAAAQAAIAATAGQLPACAGAATTAAQVQCAISQGDTITDFASNGLDSGVSYNGGFAASHTGSAAAFGGANQAVGVGTFSYPIGKAAYDALQLNARGQSAHPLPGIADANFEASYSFSRFISTAGNNGLFVGADPFFSSPSWNNRNPTADMGYGGLDRTHIFSAGGAFRPKYGPRIGLITHLESALPTTLTVDTQGGQPGEIFRSDLNGDGQTGDLMAGTEPGYYMRKFGPKTLNNLINNFNGTHANTLTPAGQALVDAGLFTRSQMLAAGAVVPTLGNTVQTQARRNYMLRTLDANFSYPIHLPRLGERFSLEPSVAMYNVANFANYGGTSGSVKTAADISQGSINGESDFALVNSVRVSRKTGVFDQGAPRATEFQLKLNF